LVTHGVIPAKAGNSVGGTRGFAFIDEPGDAGHGRHALSSPGKQRFPLSRE